MVEDTFAEASGVGEVGKARVAKQHDDEVVQARHYPSLVAPRLAGSILVKRHVSTQMEPVLDAPVGSDLYRCS